jgi:hypothetical protein
LVGGVKGKSNQKRSETKRKEIGKKKRKKKFPSNKRGGGEK